MIQFASEFSDHGIFARSEHSTDQNELWSGFFDFAILGASWDKRCTATTKCKSLKFGEAVIIKPFTNSLDNALDARFDAIFQFCHANSKNLNVVVANPSNLADTLNIIRLHLRSEIAHFERRQPARVFIDITTCPRYFTLAILGEAYRSGLVAEIVLAYSEGRYPSATPSYKDLEELSFSEGAFQAVPVPGFLGEFEPSKGKSFLVSIGFDGWKTLNLLIRKEPERVAALLASPGSTPGYEQRALAANASLLERFGIMEDRIIKATGGDAVETWQKISEADLESLDAENVYYLCSGNKPHSVALALRAIAIEVPTLLYNRVSQHLPVDVAISGIYWKYLIKPLSGTVLG